VLRSLGPPLLWAHWTPFKPVPTITLLFGAFGLGVLFAAAAREDLRQRQTVLASSATWIVVLFSFLVFAPAATYLVAYNMDWSLGYWLDSATLPVLTLPVLGLCFVAVPLGGYLLSAASSSKHSALPLFAYGGLSGGAALLSLLTGLPRLVVDGSYVEYNNQFGLRALAGSALGYSLLWAFVVLGSCVVWTYGTLRRMANKPAHHAETRSESR
jgi:hypothetical protein